MHRLIRVASFVVIIMAILWSVRTTLGNLVNGNTDATLVASYSAPDPQRDELKVTVYVTRTGEKYHRASCQHLRRSSIPMSLSEAKRAGYTPCKVCRTAR
jgi:hypothetical protein